MAEVIAYDLAKKVASALGTQAVRKVAEACNLEKDLRALQDTVNTIKGVILHAEELQRKMPEVKDWLKRVKNAAYDAEDIVDDFAIEGLHEDNMIDTVRGFASLFRFRMASRIKDIKETLDQIRGDRSFLLLETREEGYGDYRAGREHTHSYVAETNVLGRDADKSVIIQLLLDSNEQDGISIIPIQSMGGLGKTTLAQFVYNDKRVVNNFKKKMWVCVSDEFDVKRVVENIIKSATERECSHMGMDQLQNLLRTSIKEKFLLVLDDVWNEDLGKWRALKDLLMEGARGSKVIVTTRSMKAASMMQTVPTHQLSGLSDNDCWKLFKDRAFEEGKDHAYPELVEIGKEIVKKCKGVPLAATTLGSLLHFKTRKQDWNHVKDNQVWEESQENDNILSALRLSYNHLPSYLKQCFAYCCNFPKDCVFTKSELIQLWIAQGYVHYSGEDKSLEDIASEYVNILMWRSFFQEPKFDYCQNLTSFKMHNLVHDLASSVAGEESSIIFEDKSDSFPDGVRHLQWEKKSCSSVEVPVSIIAHRSLRTFLCKSKITDSLDNIFRTCKFLRVLSFETSLSELPKSIGKLKHLKFLAMSCSSIRTLPKSFTKLQSLQTLKLACPSLIELPKHFSRMLDLRHIESKGCTRLLSMPFGLKRLTSLQMLSRFVVGKTGGVGCLLNELNGLKDLGGTLEIVRLSSTRKPEECAETNLKRKPNIQDLVLEWTPDSVTANEIAFSVLGYLEPHNNLKSLEINNYPDTSFPQWMMDLRFSNVVKLSLSWCTNCEDLPAFSLLQFLEVLELQYFPVLRFMESSHSVRRPREWFPSLKTLTAMNAPNLEGWVEMGMGEDQLLVSFPSLVDLKIKKCPKLELNVLLPSIEKLYLSECCGKLVHSILQHPVTPQNSPNSASSFYPSCTSSSSLKFLEIISFEDLEYLPESGLQGLTALESLVIKMCPRLMGLPKVGLQGLTSLRSLKVECCDNLTRLSTGMRYLTALQTLKVSDCQKLQSLAGMDGLVSLRSLCFIYLPQLMYLPREIFQYSTNLQSISIRDCKRLKGLPQSLRNLTVLQELEIGPCVYLPQEFSYLTALQSLEILFCYEDVLPECIGHLIWLQKFKISQCPNIQELPDWMVYFTSLQSLEIFMCQRLQCLPEWMPRLTSLRSLNISACPQLTHRCNKETGKDWPKIFRTESSIIRT